jgi:hypothetical protein
MPTLYVVKVENPTPAWVKLDANTRLPRFTFNQPRGLSRADALALKRQADITCGGTLRVVRVEG